MTPGHRPRRLAPRLALLLGGLVLAAVLAEIAGAILLANLPDYRLIEVRRPTVWPDPDTGALFGMARNVTFGATYDRDPHDCLPSGERILYTINERGFRDLPPRQRLPNELRFAVLGDSYVFGEGVPVGDRLTEVAARKLATDLGRPARALNLGVSGYRTEDELAVARTWVPRLGPKVVLLGYCLNDPVALPEYGEFFGHDLITLRDDPAAGIPGGFPSRLIRYLRILSRQREMTRKTVQWYRQMYEGSDCAWTRSRGFLVDIRDVARGSGATFGVVLLPIFYRVGDGYPFRREHERIAAWCREHEIPVLDSQRLFEGEDTDRLTVHPRDLHPNYRAHAAIGAAVADFVREKLLVR